MIFLSNTGIFQQFKSAPGEKDILLSFPAVKWYGKNAARRISRLPSSMKTWPATLEATTAKTVLTGGGLGGWNTSIYKHIQLCKIHHVNDNSSGY